MLAILTVVYISSGLLTAAHTLSPSLLLGCHWGSGCGSAGIGRGDSVYIDQKNLWQAFDRGKLNKIF